MTFKRLPSFVNKVLQGIALLTFVLHQNNCSPLSKQKASSSTPPYLHSLKDCAFFFPNFNLCAQLSPTQNHYPTFEEVQFKLAFWDRTQGDFTGPYLDLETRFQLRPYLRLWMKMPSGDHGTTEIHTQLNPDSPSTYQVTQVIFSMPPRTPEEYWEMIIDLLNPAQQVVDQSTQVIWSYVGESHP